MAEPISDATREFGSRLAKARQELGATQDQLGDYVGIDGTTVGKIERGERNTNLHNIIRLAHGVGIDPSVLVAGMTMKMVPGRELAPSAYDKMRELRRKRGLED